MRVLDSLAPVALSLAALCVCVLALTRAWHSGPLLGVRGDVSHITPLPPAAASTPRQRLKELLRGEASHGGWRGSDAATQHPTPPKVDIPCTRFTNVCLDQGAFVFYDEQYNWQSPNYTGLPKLNTRQVKAHAQTAGDSNTDSDPRPRETPQDVWNARARTAAEGTSELQDPRFSTRTVPVVFYSMFMYNIGEFMRFTGSFVERWFATGRVTDDVSYVLSTPGGQGLHAYHTAILGAYSKYAVTTLADFSRRAVPCARVNHTAEGTMQQCFAQVHVCMRTAPRSKDIVSAGRRVVRRWAAEIPSNPLGFDLRPSVLRVLIATRHGGVRRILNMEELLEACSSSPPPDGYARVECQPHSFARVQPVTRAEFMRNLGVMQSVDVLVNIHGAEGANAYFAPPGVANLELRPCGFGTCDAAWVDMYYPTVHRENGDQIRLFAINVEDPAACRPGQHEQRRIDRGADAVDKSSAAGPGPSEDFFYARDRHVVLPPGAFVQALARVASYLRRPVEEFREMRDQGLNVAVYQNGGLTWGPAGQLKEPPR